MEIYLGLAEQYGLSWLTIENEWDDMQYFAFLDCAIRRNAQRKPSRK